MDVGGVGCDVGVWAVVPAPEIDVIVDVVERRFRYGCKAEWKHVQILCITPYLMAFVVIG